MIFGIVFGQPSFAIVLDFVHVPSLLITIGGTFTALLTSYKLKDFISGLKSMGVIFKSPEIDDVAVINKIIELSNVARKEGLLALEEVASGLEDEFMKKGILLIVDGTEPELVRGIMETEMDFMEERHSKLAGFWETMAAFGPAWGMIGTLIGLINMLGSLSDMATIGPNMSTALITTLYGSMVANWIATPTANKLKSISTKEYQSRALVVEGLLSIQAGENPRVIEEKLKSFLSPKEREGINPDEGGSAGGEG
ncbi:MAG: motility protein A [Bacteroides sp.]